MDSLYNDVTCPYCTSNLSQAKQGTHDSHLDHVLMLYLLLITMTIVFAKQYTQHLICFFVTLLQLKHCYYELIAKKSNPDCPHM